MRAIDRDPALKKEFGSIHDLDIAYRRNTVICKDFLLIVLHLFFCNFCLFEHLRLEFDNDRLAAQIICRYKSGCVRNTEGNIYLRITRLWNHLEILFLDLGLGISYKQGQIFLLQSCKFFDRCT